MSDARPYGRTGAAFSLRHLLILTTLIAFAVALFLSYQKNRQLSLLRDELIAMSSHLRVIDKDKLQLTAMQRVADDFQSWQIHIPAGKPCELRLGIGPHSEDLVPPIVDRLAIAPGQHRVTLYAGDSPREEFRYVVYVDGQQVMEKRMGSEWMPGGWSSASSGGRPRVFESLPSTMHLSSRQYHQKYNFDQNNYFWGNGGNDVTRLGYRLWIDEADRTYPESMPFLSFSSTLRYGEIGLRDGIRISKSNGGNVWSLHRPSLETSTPLLQVTPIFYKSDGSRLSSEKQAGSEWIVSTDQLEADSLEPQSKTPPTARKAFLQQRLSSDGAIAPIVELQWDTNKPDVVGFRLAEVPQNDQIARWRLRIADGSQHLWRELKVGDQSWLSSTEALHSNVAKEEESSIEWKRQVTLDFGNESTTDHVLQWRTNEKLPLQILERKDCRYSGSRLFDGLPVSFGIQIPVGMRPSLKADVLAKEFENGGTVFPGGPVFEIIQIDLEATREWLWLSAKRRE